MVYKDTVLNHALTSQKLSYCTIDYTVLWNFDEV